MSNKFTVAVDKNVAKVKMEGRLDTNNAAEFSEKLKPLLKKDIDELVLFMEDLNYISSAGLRVIVFMKQKLGRDTDVYVIAPQRDVLEVIEMAGFDSFLEIQDSYEG